MRPKQKAVSLIGKTKIGKKIVSSQRYRIILSAAVTFVFNLLYAVYLTKDGESVEEAKARLKREHKTLE